MNAILENHVFAFKVQMLKFSISCNFSFQNLLLNLSQSLKTLKYLKEKRLNLSALYQRKALQKSSGREMIRLLNLEINMMSSRWQKERVLVVKDATLQDMGTYVVMVGAARAAAHLTVIGSVFIMLGLTYIYLYHFGPSYYKVFLIAFRKTQDHSSSEGYPCEGTTKAVFNCEVNTEGAKPNGSEMARSHTIVRNKCSPKRPGLHPQIRNARLDDQANYSVSL